jgi:hypothetical protein
MRTNPTGRAGKSGTPALWPRPAWVRRTARGSKRRGVPGVRIGPPPPPPAAGGYAVYTIEYDAGSREEGVRPELVERTDGAVGRGAHAWAARWARGGCAHRPEQSSSPNRHEMLPTVGCDLPVKSF